MTSEANITDPVILVRIPRRFRPGMSDVELYEATRDVWRIGLRREHARYALTVHNGVVQEVYEILHWDRAATTPYETRPKSEVMVTGDGSSWGGSQGRPCASDTSAGRSGRI